MHTFWKVNIEGTYQTFNTGLPLEVAYQESRNIHRRDWHLNRNPYGGVKLVCQAESIGAGMLY